MCDHWNERDPETFWSDDMTEQVETTTERRTDQINLSDVAAG